MNKSTKAGRSVLWFLAACLGFAEAVAGLATRFQAPDEFRWVLIYAWFCLIAILGALLYMFIKSPEFLIAESSAIPFLASLKNASKTYPPELFQQVVQNLEVESILEPEVPEGRVDDSEKEAADDIIAAKQESLVDDLGEEVGDDERKNFEENLARFRGGGRK